jgi:hypothetical protein
LVQLDKLSAPISVESVKSTFHSDTGREEKSVVLGLLAVLYIPTLPLLVYLYWVTILKVPRESVLVEIESEEIIRYDIALPFLFEYKRTVVMQQIFVCSRQIIGTLKQKLKKALKHN